MESIAQRIGGDKIFEILASSLREDPSEYVVLHSQRDGPFAVLIAVVLSQNVSDKNSIRAFDELRSRVGVEVEKIAAAPIEELEAAIRPAGLYRQKARTIKRLAELLLSKGGEKYLIKEDPLKLREELMSVDGVGKKTVDVFLSFYRRAPVFAVDRHAMRVAMRWGLIDRENYDLASRELLKLFGPELSERAHRLVIALGRRYCRPRAPRCGDCPLRAYCPSSSGQS